MKGDAAGAVIRALFSVVAVACAGGHDHATGGPIAASPSSASPGDGPSYDALFAEGVEHASAGDLDASRAAFERALRLDGSRVEARYGLGFVSGTRCRSAGQDCAECVRDLTEVIERGGYRNARYIRGMCKLTQREHAQALADFDAALASQPGEPLALHARGLALLGLRRNEEACRDLAAAAAAGQRIDSAANDACPALGPPSRCGDEPWGGWSGDQRCTKTAKRIVPGAHRECASDADCVRVGTDCAPHAVASTSLEAYGRVPRPCTNPAAGPCAPRRDVACDRGCCIVR